MIESGFQRAIGDWQAPLPHPRMSVYRNNVAAALVSALKVRFPVTEQLVGQEFFFHMARSFAEANRPESPVLIDYGADFPGFIQGFAPAASVPYLADVASLESLWWRAYHAQDAEPLGLAALGEIPSEALGGYRAALHPSLGLMSSSFAVGAVWEAHHGGPPMDQVAINEAQAVLVSRRDADVMLRVISPAAFSFLSQLQQGRALAEAVESALLLYEDFDVAAQLGGAFSLGLITGLNP